FHEGVAGRFGPRGRKVDEIGLQLRILFSFREAKDFAGTFEVFARACIHAGASCRQFFVLILLVETTAEVPTGSARLRRQPLPEGRSAYREQCSATEPNRGVHPIPIESERRSLLGGLCAASPPLRRRRTRVPKRDAPGTIATQRR